MEETIGRLTLDSQETNLSISLFSSRFILCAALQCPQRGGERRVLQNKHSAGKFNYKEAILNWLLMANIRKTLKSLFRKEVRRKMFQSIHI